MALHAHIDLLYDLSCKLVGVRLTLSGGHEVARCRTTWTFSIKNAPRTYALKKLVNYAVRRKTAMVSPCGLARLLLPIHFARRLHLTTLLPHFLGTELCVSLPYPPGLRGWHCWTVYSMRWSEY